MMGWLKGRNLRAMMGWYGKPVLGRMGLAVARSERRLRWEKWQMQMLPLDLDLTESRYVLAPSWP
jgi:hypothetical protein